MSAKVLTKEIAEKFLADDDSVDLSKFTTIEDAAAKSLAKHKGELYLNGLTSLSDAAAAALAKYKGGEIYLDCLVSLSDVAAEILAKCPGRFLISTNRARMALSAAEARLGIEHEDDPEALRLRVALEEGDVDTARELIDELSQNQIFEAILDGGNREEGDGYPHRCFGCWEHELNSPQFVLCGKPRVVTLAEVAEKCGPIYGPIRTASIGPRPAGWGAAAGENRILSWADENLGLVGDQVMNIGGRYITARPLDEFEGALIAGPLDSVEFQELPEEKKVVLWKGRPLNMDSFDPRVFREIFNEAMRANDQLIWTYDFRAKAAIHEAVRYFLKHDDADQHTDILLANATWGAEKKNRKQLKRAIELDPSVKRWAGWIEAMIDFPDNLGQIARLKHTDPLEAALFTAYQTYVELKAGKDVSLDPLEAFAGMQRDPVSPYLSTILAHLTHGCVELALKDKNTMNDGGDPGPYTQAIRLGYRGNAAVVWLMNAIEGGANDFVRLCLDSGFKPVGRYLDGGYLNLLTTAACAKNIEAVQAFLKHGANPEEPSHFGGESTLSFGEMAAVHHIHWPEDNEGWPQEIMDALRAAQKPQP